MNRTLRRYVIDNRMHDRNRRGGYDYGHSEFEGEFRGDYESDYARTMPGGGYRRDYAGEEYETDGRRGVKYTGPYGIGGRRHYPRRDRAMYDDNDYAEGEELKLTKTEMREWKEDLQNADGTHGAHFELPQIEQAAQSLGLQMKNYDIKDLCLAANMLYSDYCAALGVAKDREAIIYTKMAKAFLDDPDASVKGREKLAAYYIAIVEDDE